MLHLQDQGRRLNNYRNSLFWAGIAACCALLSGFTCFVQVKNLGLSHHETAYLNELRAERLATLSAIGWDIYPLSHAIALNAADAFARLGVPRGPGLALLAIRLAQNALFFLLFVIYCRAWGISPYLGLLGASALAWAMPHTYGDGTLHIPLYTGYLLYLAIAIALKYRWRITALTAVALLIANISPVAVVLPEPGTWPAIVGTLGILPFLALLTLPRWPQPLLMTFAVVLVPTLLLRGAPAFALIPLLALAVLPGVLHVMQAEFRERTRPVDTAAGESA
jgi:hypothetical protein